MTRILKTLICIAAAGVILMSVVITAINIHMVSFSKKYIYNDTNELKQNIEWPMQAVIVPGARVYPDGTPCAMLQDRLDAGIDVFYRGIVSKILLTGDHGLKVYDEVNSMKVYTLEMGLKKEDVFLDHAGFSTYDSMMRAAKIFDVKSAVVSTQEFHLYRAIYIARKNGIDAYGIKADLRNYPKSEMTRYTIREWLARTKDFIFVCILKPDPEFLGDGIPITGDSSPTYD